MLSAYVFNVVQTALNNITETQKETEECKIKNQQGTENRTYIFVKRVTDVSGFEFRIMHA